MILKRTQDIPRSVDEVFAFFADAGNLEKLTPEFLQFRILTPLPIVLRPGAVIDYRLRLYGLPVSWQSRIETWEPGRRFTDVQVRGPYRRWHHTHEYTAIETGTRMTDVVEYELPWGPLGTLAQWIFVSRSLERIFDYRRDTVAQLFPHRQ